MTTSPAPRIFPYNPKTVGAYFTEACKILGIDDLHFHAGRHEATSQLFERGYQIPEVALITNHESWDTLKRYTNLKPERLRDIKVRPTRTAPRREHSKAAIPPFRPPSDAADRSAQRGRPRSPATATSVRRA
jgi:integrase